MKTKKILLPILLFFFHFSLFAQRPMTSGTVYLNLSGVIITDSFIDIPVIFFSTDTIHGLDISLQFNESVLQYVDMVNIAPYLIDALGYYSPATKALKATCNGFQRFPVNQTIFALRFKMLTKKVSKTDLFSLLGYLNGDRVGMELKGDFPFRQCSLKFWSGNSPIRYDSLTPNQYLITNIKGADMNCTANGTITVQPDVDGNFIFNTFNSPFIKIERDILPSTNIQSVVNENDMDLALKIILNDATFIPNIYQLIAMDANSDGKISAGDLSQLNLRILGKIPEFKQKWNYDIRGNSNGLPSKDWLFVDSISLAQPIYTISTTYPMNDGIGSSKTNVPVVSFCLSAPSANASLENSTYTGILLGDSDGNYTDIVNDGKLKRIVLRGNYIGVRRN